MTTLAFECETNAATGRWGWSADGFGEDENARVKGVSTSAVTLAVLVGLCSPGTSFGTAFRLEGESYGVTKAKQEAYWEALTQSGETTTPSTLAGGSVIMRALAQISGDLTEDIESRRLLRKLIQRYGEPSIRAIDEWAKLNSRKQTLVAEIMRLLGDVDDPATKSARVELLGRGLQSSSPVVRDSSALGLEDVGDSRAIPLLESAIENEPYESLKLDYKMIADSLKS
jgi:hypothetical protein